MGYAFYGKKKGKKSYVENDRHVGEIMMEW
jgi:hypothetical protein